MRSRLRAYAGLWLLVALLGVATVFTASAAVPLTTGVQDDGLRRMVADASYTTRDLQATRPAHEPDEAERMRDILYANLPSSLTEVVGVDWGYHYTQVVPGGDRFAGAGLIGDGVEVSDFGLAPVVLLHHQPGIDQELSLADGEAPATDPDGDTVEVMVSARVAKALGLEVGTDYTLHPGQLGLMRHPRTGEWATAGGLVPADEQPALAVRVTGVFTPDDETAPVWDHAAALVNPSFITLPIGDPPHPPAPRGGLVTDEAGFQQVLQHDEVAVLRPTAGVRLRLDPAALDSAWATDALEAVARAQTDPALRNVPVETGLTGLLEEFRQVAAAMRAVVAVAAAGLLATLVGLLVLAARLIMDRRRAEVELLRARGGSLVAVIARMALEALPVALLAGLAGWLLHRFAAGEALLGVPEAVTPIVLGGAALLIVWLVVPATAAMAARGAGVTAVRADLGRRRAHPARLTAELCVALLAVSGVLLVQQRGLASEGVDPYLSAVPVLLAVAVGLVALRLYPWPLRLLAALARRLRGVVSFVGLARAGRAAPGAALALLVLALAVAVGGFAGAVNAGVEDARSEGALHSVGAHVQVAVDELPPGAVEAVSRVPGVEVVVSTARGGIVRESPVRNGNVLPARDLQGVQVVTTDIEQYQQLLSRLGVDAELPPELLSATAADDPLPVLAAPGVADRNQPQVWVDDVVRDVVPVGDVTGLPGPDRGGTWVLVPSAGISGQEQFAPDRPREDTQVSEHVLLVAGAEADPEAVRVAVADLPEAGEVTVTSMQGFRAELDESGFNAGLTLVLVAGTAGAILGAVLAVALALVVQARARGRVLSLMRTMGMSSRQARGLLLVELLPLTTLAVLAGGVVGAAMPLLLGAALGLEEFTGGVSPTLGIEPLAVGVLAGLVLALVLIGAAIETAINRRLGLGAVLRVD